MLGSGGELGIVGCNGCRKLIDVPIEKIASESGGEGCLIFYLELTGVAVPKQR